MGFKGFEKIRGIITVQAPVLELINMRKVIFV
jgi:hypothetical protein